MSMPFYALAYAGTAACQKGLGFLLLLWLAQALPVEEYAQFGLLFALQAGLTTLAGAGIVDAAIGRLGHEAAANAALFRAANTVFVLLATIASIAAAALYWSLHGQVAEVRWAMLFVLIGGVLSAFFGLQSTLVRLEEQHSASLVLGFLGPMSGLVGAFVGFALQGSIAAFFGGMAAGLATAAVACRAAGVGHFSAVWGTAETRTIARSAAPYLVIAVLAWVGGYGSTYFVLAWFAPRDVAMFTFAYTLSSVLQLVASSANQVWSPRFFRNARSQPVDELERLNNRFFAWQGFALGATGGVLLLALAPATAAAGGQLVAYGGLTFELFLLFAGYAVAIPWWHAQNYFLVNGLGPELLKVVAITSVLGIGVWLLAMALLGVTGVYAGFCFNMLVRSAGSLAWARRHWNLRLLWRGPLGALVMLGAATWLALLRTAT